MAAPGDVVGHFGKHDVMMSKDLYIALLGQDEIRRPGSQGDAENSHRESIR